MARAMWLRDVLEDLRKQGVPVHTVSGWDTRGSTTFDPKGIICHDTGGSATSTDAGEIHTLLTGSATAPAPISQFFLSRTTGVHLVAAGRCNHALTGQAGPLAGLGNTNLIGIEAAANPGRPWPPAQYRWYVQLVAAICKRRGWNPHQNVAAHREHQPRQKVDPQGIDMARFRADVQAALRGSPAAPDPTLGDDEMLPFLVKYPNSATVYLCHNFLTHRSVSGAEFTFLQNALKSNGSNGVVYEWPETARPAMGVNLDSVDDPVVPLTDEQLAKLGAQIKVVAGPSLDDIRGVVDAELDEQSRAGADQD